MESNKQSHKSAKKKARWLLLLLWIPVGGILSLFVSWWLVMSWKGDQNLLTTVVNSYLKKYSHSESSVGNVVWDFPSDLALENICLYDHKDSVLFKAGIVQLQVAWPLVQPDSSLHIHRLVVSNFEANMKRYQGDKKYNYYYSFDIPPSEKKDQRAIKSFAVHKLVLENGAFDYKNYTRNPMRRKGDKAIDFYRLETENLYAELNSILIDKGFQTEVAHLSIEEVNGFSIQKISSNLYIDSQSFDWDNLLLKTNKSQVKGKVHFDFENWTKWSAYNDSVRMDFDLGKSILYQSDLDYFTESLPSFFTKANLRGNVRGVLAEMNLPELDVQLDDYAAVSGQINTTGLPILSNTYVTSELDNSWVNFEKMTDLPFLNKLPEQLDVLEKLSYSGKLAGDISQIISQGQIDSRLGQVLTDMTIELDSINSKYYGHLNVKSFDIGALSSVDDLGILSFDADLDASGNQLDNLIVNADGQVNRMDFRGYSYTDIVIDARLRPESFEGKLVSKDPNAKLDLDGTLDFSQQNALLKVKSTIDHLALLPLKIGKDTIVAQGKLTMDFSGQDIESFVGKILAKDFELSVNRETFQTQDMAVKSSLITGGKYWDLNSEFLDADLRTSLRLDQVADVILNKTKSYLPKNRIEADELKAGTFIKGHINLKNPSIVNALMPEKIEILSKVQASVTLNEDSSFFFASVDAPWFTWEGRDFLDLAVKLDDPGSGLVGHINLGYFIHEKFSIDGLEIGIQEDSNQFVLSQKGNLSDTLFSFDMTQQISKSTDENNLITFLPSEFLFNDEKVHLNIDSLWWLGFNQFSFQKLDLQYLNQSINLSGDITTDGSYDLAYKIEDLVLEHFQELLPSSLSDVKAVINGKGTIKSGTGFPQFETSVVAFPLAYKNLDFGKFSVESDYNPDLKRLDFASSLQDLTSRELFNIQGGIQYGPNKTIDLQAKAEALQIAFFEPLLVGLVSDLKGTATGSLVIAGPLDKPQIKGQVALDSAQLHVDYLGTDYHFQDRFAINTTHILVSKLDLQDDKGNKAQVNGKIRHDFLSTFDLDLAMTASNFHLLNTKEADNSMYYGQFYGTGTASFKGPLAKVALVCDLQTEKGSKFFLPIQEDQGYSQQSYIRFVKPESTQEEFILKDKTYSLDLTLTMTPLAEAQLIFDKKLGDIIKANGNGRINFSLSPAGEFQMFGDYVINQGNYLFTAFDLINKRFEIEKESKISWTGSPYDALIDIKANYHLKADAYNLAKGLPQYDQSKLEQYKTPVPVVAYALLKGSLLNPDITLDFDFIEDGSQDLAALDRELNQLQLSEEELTKQVVSLLVLNRFMPMYNSNPINTDIFNSGVNTGLGDLISNQLTYWLSSISDDLQVNVNYRSAYESDGILLSQGELELALSTTFLSDRVTVDFAYELQNGYSPNKEIGYKVNPDGSVKIILFQRQTQNPVVTYNSNTYGFGLFLKREFDSFRELFRKKDPKKE